MNQNDYCSNNNGLSGVGESKLNDLGLGNEMNCNICGVMREGFLRKVGGFMLSSSFSVEDELEDMCSMTVDTDKRCHIY